MQLLTDAQKWAIRWLPADGSWTIKSPGSRSSALGSLTLFRKDIAEAEFGNFGARGGKCVRRRLTAEGMLVRAGLDVADTNNQGTI